jgi:hypothetical protein
MDGRGIGGAACWIEELKECAWVCADVRCLWQEAYIFNWRREIIHLLKKMTAGPWECIFKDQYLILILSIKIPNKSAVSLGHTPFLSYLVLRSW